VSGGRRRQAFVLALLLVVALGCGLLLGPGSARAWDADRFLRQSQRFGPRATEIAQALIETIQLSMRGDEEQRLTVINQFFNRRILFREDTEVWGQIDYWASPLEMFGKGAGDCEDYAIGKYFALTAAGIAPARLRLVYVKAMLGGVGGVQQAHMVLAYYPGPTAEPLILDNLIGDIRPASRRPDLVPVFSFNADGLWQGTQGPDAGDPTQRLSRWREVLAKVREQGLY